MKPCLACCFQPAGRQAGMQAEVPEGEPLTRSSAACSWVPLRRAAKAAGLGTHQDCLVCLAEILRHGYTDHDTCVGVHLASGPRDIENMCSDPEWHGLHLVVDARGWLPTQGLAAGGAATCAQAAACQLGTCAGDAQLPLKSPASCCAVIPALLEAQEPPDFCSR